MSEQDDADVIEPHYVRGLADEAGAIRDALHSPVVGPQLRDLVRRGASVGISVCDVTRPFPGRRVLPIVLDELRDIFGSGHGTNTLFSPGDLA